MTNYHKQVRKAIEDGETDRAIALGVLAVVNELEALRAELGDINCAVQKQVREV